MLTRAFLVPALICLTGSLCAEDQKANAKALVKEAIALAKTKGLQALLKEVNNPKGRFHVQSGEDNYIFVYAEDGTCLGQGFRGNLVGVNRMNVKDPDGKFYIQELIKTGLSKGGGWVDYKYPNPTTGKVLDKTTYVESFDGKVVGCGVYK
jgi:cytochrome c